MSRIKDVLKQCFPFLVPIKRKLLQPVFDFLLYYLAPRKTIVIILSSMRSGSTLLKALMAEAPDVSHLLEVEYREFDPQLYAFYREAYYLNPKRIIVLKKPRWFNNVNEVWEIPKSPRIKLVVLNRDVIDVVKSLHTRNKEGRWADLDFRNLINYWCDAYERIAHSVEEGGHATCCINYEELVANPKEVTKRVFDFIGSKQHEGVDRYSEPEGDKRWQWGRDDAGKKIHSFKVDPKKKPDSRDNELRKIVDELDRIKEVESRLSKLRNDCA